MRLPSVRELEILNDVGSPIGAQLTPSSVPALYTCPDEAFAQAMNPARAAPQSSRKISQLGGELCISADPVGNRA